MSSLSPRATSCLPEDSEAAKAISLWLLELGLSSSLQIASWFDSPSDLVSELPGQLQQFSTFAVSFYERIDKVAAAVTISSAKADMVGGNAPQLWPPRVPDVSAARSAPSASMGPTFRGRKLNKRARKTQDKELTSAQMVEAQRLDEAMELAFGLAQLLLECSPRLVRFNAQGLAWDDQCDLLKPLFKRRASAATTLRANVRTVHRFLAWAEAAHVCPWSIAAEHLAIYLRDSARRGRSVPKTIWAALDWARDVFDFSWPLGDPIVEAQRHSSAVQAEAAREQAPPLTKEIIENILDAFFDAVNARDAALVVYTGFIIVLALACLRWSDLQRSCNIDLSKDSLFGECWKSKKKLSRMPWAAPRRDWRGRDWAGPFYSFLGSVVELSTADFVVPAPGQHGIAIYIDTPLRPSSYAAALNIFRLVMRDYGGVDDALQWSLHSPRFFLPSLAGQMRFSLEERRTLGRWGPASGMPVRYDRARCVTELLLKNEIVSELRRGFQPAGPFELPSQADVRPMAPVTRLQTQEPELAMRGAPLAEAELEDAMPAEVGASRYPYNERLQLVLNIKSKMLHVRDDLEPGKARCPFWWSQSRAPVEPVMACRQDYPDYTLCGQCWGRRANSDQQLWQTPEDNDESAAGSASEACDEASSSSSSS